MRDLNYQLKQLCRRNRDGSYATQRDRERLLTLIADQLLALGFRGLGAQSLKPKHVDALVAHWQLQGLSTGTQRNRMAALRWWAEKVNRQNVIARGNDFYGIPSRVLIASRSKSLMLDATTLQRVTDPYVRMSLELQQAFGLRREEAIKFQPSFADRGDHLALKDSWTKGGKARIVPVRSAAQRAVLDRAHRLVGRGSLIPHASTYRRQLRVYERHTANAGLSKLHGLRHAYAQQRYWELTGRLAPAVGGLGVKHLTSTEYVADRDARLAISRELGHERAAITTIYLGR